MSEQIPPWDDLREHEANAFAMALLMPEAMLRSDCAAIGHAPCDDDIKALATRYEVETHVMTARLFQLKLVRPL